MAKPSRNHLRLSDQTQIDENNNANKEMFEFKLYLNIVSYGLLIFFIF
jgi:hypothetical protein